MAGPHSVPSEALSSGVSLTAVSDSVASELVGSGSEESEMAGFGSEESEMAGFGLQESGMVGFQSEVLCDLAAFPLAGCDWEGCVSEEWKS